MRALFFIMLVGYTVKCDDSSYYVVEIPEEPTRLHKPFKVYWNVPTMQCRSKKIPFTKLFEKYGIVQNANDSFRGEKIAILYDPGLFPALFKSENGSFKFRNGGVPQEGDLEKHLEAFRETMEQSIPDPDFNGVGIIDFESWRPVFRQNFGVLAPYKDISYQIERKLHWFWPEKAIQSRARQRFEEAARSFMQATLSLARLVRPRALWGYYAFPYCFNMSPNNMLEACASGVPRENDNISWLWRGSSALYPSVYTAPGSRLGALAALVRGRVREAERLRPAGAPILPYFWYRHRDGTYLSQDELNTVLATLYNSNASGFIIWGSSNDVNTVEKCKKLHRYTEEVLGPSVSKYTKRNGNSDTTANTIDTTTTTLTSEQINNKTTEKAVVNVNNSWINPDKITQDILQLVENKQNKSKYDTEQGYLSIQKKTFLEMLFNMLTNERETENEYLINSGNDTENKSETEELVTLRITSTDSSNLSESKFGIISVVTSQSSVQSDNVTTTTPEQIIEDDEYNNKSDEEELTNKTSISTNKNTMNILKSSEKLNNNSHFYFLFNNNIIDKSFEEQTNDSTSDLQAIFVTESYTEQPDTSIPLLNESSLSNSSRTVNSNVEDTITTTNGPVNLKSTDILVTNTESAHQIENHYEFSSTTDSYQIGDITHTDEYLYADTNIQNRETSTKSDVEFTTDFIPKTLTENNKDEIFYNDIVSLAINITELMSSGFTNIQDGDKILRLDDVNAEISINTDNTTRDTINTGKNNVPDQLNKEYQEDAVTDETSTNSVRQVVALL